MAKYEVKDSTGFWLTLAARKVEAEFDSKLKEIGISRFHYCILNAIENSKMTCPSEIADYLSVERSAVSRALDKLEKVGHIKRTRSKEDKRFISLALSAKGQKVLPKLIASSVHANKQMKKILSETEIKQLRKILVKIGEHMTATPKSL